MFLFGNQKNKSKSLLYDYQNFSDRFSLFIWFFRDISRAQEMLLFGNKHIRVVTKNSLLLDTEKEVGIRNIAEKKGGY